MGGFNVRSTGMPELQLREGEYITRMHEFRIEKA